MVAYMGVIIVVIDGEMVARGRARTPLMRDLYLPVIFDMTVRFTPCVFKITTAGTAFKIAYMDFPSAVNCYRGFIMRNIGIIHYR